MSEPFFHANYFDFKGSKEWEHPADVVLNLERFGKDAIFDNMLYTFNCDENSKLINNQLRYVYDLSPDNAGELTPHIVSLADYYPGGMQMPGRTFTSEEYRFGYQGQFAEKDAETGYNAFELRLYDSRLVRWHTTDPYGQYWSPYMAMGNNWISNVDVDGGYDFPTNGWQRFWNSVTFRGDLNQSYNMDVTWSSEFQSYLTNYDANAIGSNSSNFLSSAGLSNSFIGYGTAMVSNNLFKTSNIFFKSLQAQSNSLKLGLNYTDELAKTSNLLKGAKTIGRYSFITGSLISAGEFGMNPTIDQGLKSSLDVTMGAVGAFGGPPGLIISGGYFLIDATIGVENVGKATAKQTMLIHDLHSTDGVMSSPWLFGK